MSMGLVVVGAGGRMGRALVRAIADTPGAHLAAAIEREGSPFLGKDASELAGVGPLDVAERATCGAIRTGFGRQECAPRSSSCVASWTKPSTSKNNGRCQPRSK